MQELTAYRAQNGRLAYQDENLGREKQDKWPSMQDSRICKYICFHIQDTNLKNIMENCKEKQQFKVLKMVKKTVGTIWFFDTLVQF